jgi:hypothetical protein
MSWLGYVYAQTDRDFLNLVSLIRSESRSGRRQDDDLHCLTGLLATALVSRDQFGVDYSGKLPDFDRIWKSGDRPPDDHRQY